MPLCQSFDAPRHDGPLYRLSLYNLISAHIAGFLAGVGRRALDEFMVAATIGQVALGRTPTAPLF
jgi:hypothetical protein